jgi:hypothetical protein
LRHGKETGAAEAISWLGEVEAPNEAIEKTVAEFKVPATKLMAIPR